MNTKEPRIKKDRAEKKLPKPQRTKIALTNAMLDLLENNSYDKITVLDICEKAMMHRATFYNHFKDKEDLLAQFIESLEKRLFTIMMSNEESITPRDTFQQMVTTAINFIDINKERMRKMLRNNRYERIFNMIFNATRKNIAYSLEKMKLTENVNISLDALSTFFTGGFTTLTIMWIIDPKKYTRDTLLNQMIYIIDHNSIINQ